MAAPRGSFPAYRPARPHHPLRSVEEVAQRPSRNPRGFLELNGPLVELFETDGHSPHGAGPVQARWRTLAAHGPNPGPAL